MSDISLIDAVLFCGSFFWVRQLNSFWLQKSSCETDPIGEYCCLTADGLGPT